MYLVAGVSGNTGGAAASALLEKRQPVRVLVRNEENGRPWRDRGAEVAVASLEDAAGLARAMKGVKGAYVLIPPDVQTTSYMGRGRRFLGAITEALGSAQIPHVVFLSSIGAQHETGNGPVALLHEGEKRLSGLRATRATFIRAAYFMENIRMVLDVARTQGVLPCTFDPNLRIPMIASGDIGRTIAQALLEPPAQREVIELESLQEWSYADAARILSKLLGHPVQAVRVPEENVVPTLLQSGFSEDVAGLFKEMAKGIEGGVLRFQGDDARHVRGPTTLENILAKLV
jgi:uncharacterized protein YbjT (DUF2867 family)